MFRLKLSENILKSKGVNNTEYWQPKGYNCVSYPAGKTGVLTRRAIAEGIFMALSVSLTFKVSRIIEFAGVVSVSCYWAMLPKSSHLLTVRL